MKKLFTLIAVAAMAFAAQANTLVVCDAGYDGYQSAVAPIYGLWADTEGTMAQMIYTADMLQDMVGCEITEVKFTTTAYWYENFGDISDASYTSYINFDDATIQLSFLSVEGGFEGMAFNGATPVATTVPVSGEDNMTFVLDEPFVYEGGDLMIECKVIVPGSYGTTYFFGTGFDEDVQCCYYGYESYSGWTSSFFSFLPMVTFEYEGGQAPVEPTEKTGAPVFHGYTEDGIHAYFVEILETEPSVIYYRVQYPDGSWTEWAEYEEILSFVGDGKYRVEAYAVADGKLPSEQIAYEFVVSPRTGLSELAGDNAVASVRYFNAAGQEMSEINGLTIVVTRYTDGTTSTAKVIK